MITGIRKGQWDAFAFAIAILLVFSFAFGGASREHALRLALVELVALPVLVLAGARLQRDQVWSRHRMVLGIAAAVAILPLVQLIPLPPAVWTGLPGREQLSLALSLSELPPGWLPLSLTPDLTWRAFLALLPPLAAFLAVLAAPRDLQVRLVYLVLIAVTVSILLGVVQLASGGVRFYPWTTTGAGNVTGFFANRNHLATLLLVSLPFAAVLAGGSLRRGSARKDWKLIVGAAFIGLVVVAIGAVRSRAGIILVGPTLMLSLLAAWIATGRGRPTRAVIGGLAAVGVAMAAVALFGLAPIIERFDRQGVPEGRFENWPVVAEAAQVYLPVGSGLGSFDTVYRSVEPLERLDPTYFNQAHNEYLEIWLETGWAGIALLFVFLVWWGRRSWACWRAPPSTEADIQRAASVGILVMLVHSAGDYPLRTATMAMILGLCAALLEGAATQTAHPESGSRSRRRTRRSSPAIDADASPVG